MSLRASLNETATQKKAERDKAKTAAQKTAQEKIVEAAKQAVHGILAKAKKAAKLGEFSLQRAISEGQYASELFLRTVRDGLGDLKVDRGTDGYTNFFLIVSWK
jgi:regulator of protease activity HflC (stomatin/prohibitin superfamily)